MRNAKKHAKKGRPDPVTSERVMLGMSGGVDSSLAGALLLEQGYEVVGVTMQLMDASESVLKAARRAADHLGIRHEIVDLRAAFHREVITPFIEEYCAGRTPNPCILCNPIIKFGALWEAAQVWRPEYMATGHYLRTRYDATLGQHRLCRPRDQSRDQTYMLYRLQPDQVMRTLFPLGEYSKEAVRLEAKKRGLPSASQPDSQEICFVPDDYRDFLARHAAEAIEAGPILDRDGNVLGEHRGLPFYTVGQRRGLGISAEHPLYVLQLDAENNALIVGPERDLDAGGARLHDVHLMVPDHLVLNTRFRVQIRYSSPPVGAHLVPRSSTFDLVFDTPQKAVTPGQSAVFYQGDCLLGGGIIDRALPVG